MPQRISTQQLFIGQIEIQHELFGIRKPLGPGGKRFHRIQFFYDFGRVSRRYAICGDVIHYHRTGSDNAVFTDGDTLADNNAVADPYVIFNLNGCGFPDGNSIVNIMPVRIGNIGIAGNHTVIADEDFMSRANSHSGTN